MAENRGAPPAGPGADDPRGSTEGARDTGAPESESPEALRARERFSEVLGDVLSVVDDPDGIEDLHRQLFGEDVGDAFEEAAVAQVSGPAMVSRGGAAAAESKPSRIESFVRLAFRHARKLTTPAEEAELAELEAELRRGEMEEEPQEP